MKRLQLLLSLLVVSAPTWAQPLVFQESAGWLESAYVKWLPVDSAENYHVYYSGEGVSDKIIDDKLIRNYGTYCRADVLGLKAGTYTLRVVPVISGVEREGAVSNALTVEAHDRTGFAFWNGRIPGAYKADGTPKENSVILYITENTKDSVSIEVTGANANPCIGLQAILDGFKKGKDNRPLIVRLVGQITDPGYMLNGDVVIENNNNASGYITLEGVGDDAVADGWGIRVKTASNIEIRNLGLMNCDSDEGDDIGLQQDNDHIWVHQCDFFYGNAGSDADQIKGDGALDSKRSGFVTFSYNHFWDTGKSNLLGNGVEEPQYLTYHHNWYDHSDSRHPRVRSHSVHVYNNYYDGNAKYGVGATNASSVFVEANYFRNCKYPMLISMQGSDVYDETTQTNDYTDMPIFSKEDGGSIKAFNNQMTGQKRFVPYGDSAYPNSTVDFDAYVVTNKNDTVSRKVVSFQGLNTYNNFDTNASVMYTYTADSPEAAREKVMDYAGRLNGGDLQWTFDNAVDDAAYSVNTGLKAALVGYKTRLVSIQGDGKVIADTSGNGNNQQDSIANVIQNFTLSGLTSSFFSITGNLSSSKGSIDYAGLTLTQCLKIESTTSISFTTTKEATLTLVFNTDFTGRISIDGTSYSATAGLLTKILPAGSHQISKVDAANLYYISLIFNPSALPDVLAAKTILYPNPVKNDLYIHSDLEVEKVGIYRMDGVLVKKSDLRNRVVDLSLLSPGSYRIVVWTKKGSYHQTILKK
jgi:pectate lyase